jgi:hypothetical protein
MRDVRLIALVVFGFIAYEACLWLCKFIPPAKPDPPARYTPTAKERQEIEAQLALRAWEQERQATLKAALAELDAEIKEWEAAQVENYRDAVQHGLMTPEQFQAITGQPYRRAKPAPKPVTVKNPFAR